MTRTNETTTAKGTLSYDDAMYLMDRFNDKVHWMREDPDLELSIHATWDRFGDRRIRIECQPSAIGFCTMDDTIERCALISKTIKGWRSEAWFEGYEVAKFTTEDERARKGTLLRTDAEHIIDRFNWQWSTTKCDDVEVNACEDEDTNTLQVLTAIGDSKTRDLPAGELHHWSETISHVIALALSDAWFEGYKVID